MTQIVRKVNVSVHHMNVLEVQHASKGWAVYHRVFVRVALGWICTVDVM